MTAARKHRRKNRARSVSGARGTSGATDKPRPRQTEPRPEATRADTTEANRIRPAARRPNGDQDGRAVGYRPRCRFRPRPRGPEGGCRQGTDANQRGFVTAELAVALPVVVAVLALSMWAVATVGMQVRLTDAAHSAALAAARGEDPQVVAAAYLPEGATMSVSRDGDVVRTTVTAPSRPLGPLAPEVEISAEGAAPKEPGLPE